MTTQLIGSALDRVLHSKTFARSRSLQDFLTFIVTQSLEPDQNLKEYRIGADALKRGGTFDPAENSIVRVQAYRLRAKLADYYQHEGQTEDVRIDLAPGSYTPVIRECAVVATLRTLRFSSLILDILPCDAAPGSDALVFLHSVLSTELERLLRTGLSRRIPARSAKLHLQLELRARASSAEIRAITYLSDPDAGRVAWSAGRTLPSSTGIASLAQTLESAGREIAQNAWRKIDELLSCNG